MQNERIDPPQSSIRDHPSRLPPCCRRAHMPTQSYTRAGARAVNHTGCYAVILEEPSTDAPPGPTEDGLH